MGPIRDCFDAVIEAFWARMQVELLNRQRWRTRLELYPQPSCLPKRRDTITPRPHRGQMLGGLSQSGLVHAATRLALTTT